MKCEFSAELTCGCSSGSRMWASSRGRWRSRMMESWATHVSKEVTTVSSSGTLTSSDVSSLSISSTGSRRNSWPPTTSKKCSWWRWNGFKNREGKSQISLTRQMNNELGMEKEKKRRKKIIGRYECKRIWVEGWKERGNKEGNEVLRKVRGR